VTKNFAPALSPTAAKKSAIPNSRKAKFVFTGMCQTCRRMLPTWLRINATRWQINENQNTKKPAELQLQSVSPPGSWQPDALRQIALEAIEPFFDKTLDARVEAAERQWFKKRTPPARQTPELAIVGRAHRESSHSARRSDGGLSGAPKQDTDQLLYAQASGQFKSQTPSSTTSTICPTALHHRRRLRRCRAQTQSAENARKSVMMMALGNKTQSPPRKLVIGQACLKVE